MGWSVGYAEDVKMMQKPAAYIANSVILQEQKVRPDLIFLQETGLFHPDKFQGEEIRE
jgi:hypothetical protein